jgi:hypothetical protein
MDIIYEYNESMDRVILSCVYGDKHTPFVYTFVYSALQICPDYKIIIGYTDFPKFELDLLHIAFPNVKFVELKGDTSHLGTHASRASMKVKLWNQLFQNHLHDGDFGVFLDIDTILLKLPFEELADDGQLFLTRKNGKWPLNTGVLFAKKCESTKRVFLKWESETVSILSATKTNQEAEVASGGADQHALLKVLGIENEIRDESISSFNDENLEVRVEFVQCRIYNQTESVPLEKNIKIVHFKAGWHKILLQSAPYTKNRPENSSSEMHGLWQATYFRANKLLYENLNLKAWGDDALIQDVSAIDYEFRGIYNSELVLITSLFKSLNITKILESGRARGHSTFVVSKILEPDRRFLLVSIDFKRDQASLYAEERLKGNSSVELLYGDSNILLGKISKGKRIEEGEGYGVILDGPKGLNAIFLSIKLMRSKRPPKIIFIHDMRKLERGKPSFHRYICSLIFDRVFFSDEFSITPQVLATDKSVFNFIEPGEQYPIRPFHKGYYNTGSYGPTLAIILPSQKDTHILARFLRMPFNRVIFFFKQLMFFQISSLIRKSKFDSYSRGVK